MNNPGFYIVNTSQHTVSRPENLPYTGQTTLKDNIDWEKYSLMFNGHKVGEAYDVKDLKGARVVKQKLILNGDNLINAISAKPQLRPSSLGFQFDTVQVKEPPRYINITLQNYNKLISGNDIVGYKQFDRSAIYNIVDSVATAPSLIHDEVIAVDKYPNSPTHFTKDSTGKVVNLLEECVEDNIQTFTDPYIPDIEVMPYERIIYSGDDLILNFNIDTYNHDYLYNNSIGTTFTTIVETGKGKIYKKTTYAGRVTMVIPNNVTSNKTEEMWFSVRTIQDNGVSSAVQYFDYLVKQHEPEKLYQVTSQDLVRYDIVANNSDPIISYKNKGALTKLFSDISNKKDSSGNKLYNGIKLYNSGNTIYYINYKPNLSDEANTYDFGSTSFYLYRVQTINGKKKITERQPITNGTTLTINGTQVVVNQDPLDWIRNDGANLYRNPNGKIRVEWEGRYLNPAKEVKVTASDDDYAYLRTYSHLIEVEKDKLSDTPKASFMRRTDGYYYVVFGNYKGVTLTYDTEKQRYSSGGNSPRGGDPIKIPDNFIVDLNGSTFKATDYYGIRVNGILLEFIRNFNSVIRNGKLVGPYADIDFPKASLLIGHATIEGLTASRILHSKYCTYENMEICQMLGYDGGAPGMPQTDDDPSFTMNSNATFSGNENSSFPVFNQLGYINYNGTFINPYNSNTQGRKVKSTSSDYEANKDREISLVTLNQGIVTNRFFFKDAKANKKYMSSYFYVSAGGYDFKSGKYPVCFVHFYDDSNKYIKTIKSIAWRPIRIPDNAATFKITIFGLSEKNDSNQRVVATREVTINNKTCIRGIATEKIGVKASYYGINNAWKNCYIHHTRTVAICPFSRNVYYIGNHYSNIAIEKDSTYQLTAYLMDLEEGGNTCNFINLINCTVDREYDSLNGALSAITCNLIRGVNINVINCTGFGFSIHAGIQSGYFTGDFGGMWLRRGHRSIMPYLIFEDCIFNNGFGTEYKNDSLTATDSSDSYRYNRCDDDVDNRIVVRDSLLLYCKKGTSSGVNALPIPVVIAYRSKIADVIYK